MAAVCACVASQAFLDTSQATIRCGFRPWDTRSLAPLAAFCDSKTQYHGGQRKEVLNVRFPNYPYSAEAEEGAMVQSWHAAAWW